MCWFFLNPVQWDTVKVHWWSQTHHCHQKKPDELPDIYRLKRRQHNPWKATQERNSAAKF